MQRIPLFPAYSRKRGICFSIETWKSVVETWKSVVETWKSVVETRKSVFSIEKHGICFFPSESCYFFVIVFFRRIWYAECSVHHQGVAVPGIVPGIMFVTGVLPCRKRFFLSLKAEYLFPVCRRYPVCRISLPAMGKSPFPLCGISFPERKIIFPVCGRYLLSRRGKNA